MTIKVLINPESGSVNAYGFTTLKDEISRDLADVGFTADFVYGGAPDLRLYTEALIEKQNVDLIICVGGDGTLAAVAQALIGRDDVPILPLPGGTMNLFVRDMKIPDKLKTALSHTIQGQPKKIDVGMIDDRVFINNVVFGAYAEIADARESLRAAKTPAKTMEAIVDAADAVFNAEPRRYTLSGTQINREIESNILMVANNIYTGADLLRPIRKRINEGKLGVYLADSVDGPDLVMRIAEAVAGRLADSQSIHIDEVTDCTISSDRPFSVTIDGDPVVRSGAVHVRSVPRALTVICPAPENGG